MENWHATLVFKPLLGEQYFINEFYSNSNLYASPDPEKDDYFYINEYCGNFKEVVTSVSDAYPGITFIGYFAKYNNDEREFHQILFNKSHGVIFSGPVYHLDSQNERVLFDTMIKLPIIRGTVLYHYDAAKDSYVTSKETETRIRNEEAGYGVNYKEPVYFYLNEWSKLDELTKAIAETYRYRIGIREEDYNKIVEMDCQSGYTSDGIIIRGNEYDKIWDIGKMFPEDPDPFDPFQRELILKKTVSDLDAIAIREMKNGRSAKDIDLYLKHGVFVPEIAEKHIDYYKSENTMWNRTAMKNYNCNDYGCDGPETSDTIKIKTDDDEETFPF